MRLWHIDLISKLPRQQLLGQHRECCAMRGKGWGKKHSTVDYVWEYDYLMLWSYHMSIMFEMRRRNYNVDDKWLDQNYRGKIIGYVPDHTLKFLCKNSYTMTRSKYPEHNENYYQECIDNLKGKGIIIDGHR